MKRRQQATESPGFGTFLQILVVGVLLFAVIWQVNGHLQDEPALETTGPPVAVNDADSIFRTTDSVNLRQGPGMDHDVISVVPMHAEVLVTGSSLHGFFPVEIEGTSAWISEHYVVPEGAVLGGISGDLPVTGEIPAPSTDVDPESIVPEEVVAPVEIPAGESQVATQPDTPAEREPVTVAAEIPVEDAPAPLAAQTWVEPAAAEPVVEEPGERWVDVDRSTGLVTLHEGNAVITQFQGLVGKDPSPDGYYSTAVGTFYVHSKVEELAETPFAPGVYLTHFVGFDPARSNGFHSPTRDADGNVVLTGGTTTLGCVRLGEQEAIRMFEFAYIGMRVEVHD